MKSEQERPVGKMRYEKPTAVDLGPTAPIVGASCAPGQLIGDVGPGGSKCDWVGNSATDYCGGTGNSAGFTCSTGDTGPPP